MESFPGEVDTLRADNARLRHLLRLTEEQACALPFIGAEMNLPTPRPVCKS